MRALWLSIIPRKQAAGTSIGHNISIPSPHHHINTATQDMEPPPVRPTGDTGGGPSMPPPPAPATAAASNGSTTTESSSSSSCAPSMPPPPPSTSASSSYTPPAWGGRPAANEPAITLDVIRSGVELDTLDLHSDNKDHYTFGRMPGAVAFVLDNPTVSRVHAVAQFRKVDGALLLQDLGSTHGTFVNKDRIPPKPEWVELRVGDMVQFGASTRLYVVNGPEEYAAPEVCM